MTTCMVMKNMYFKLYAVVLSVVLVACSSNSEEDLGDGQKRLQQITIKEHEKKFGEISSIGELYEQYTYNEKGLLVHKVENHIMRSDIGRVKFNTYYTYDEQGRLVTKEEEGLSDYVYKYTYNDIDSVATMHVYNDDGNLSESWTYTYDNKKRLLQAKQTYDLLIAYVDDYTYSGNNVTVVRHRVDNGELFGTHLHEYDSHGNLVKTTWVSGSTGKEDVEVLNEYDYDLSGKMIKKISHGYYTKSDLTYYDYTYNAEGLMDKVHISYSYKDYESELRYETYMNVFRQRE